MKNFEKAVFGQVNAQYQEIYSGVVSTLSFDAAKLKCNADFAFVEAYQNIFAKESAEVFDREIESAVAKNILDEMLAIDKRYARLDDRVKKHIKKHGDLKKQICCNHAEAFDDEIVATVKAPQLDSLRLLSNKYDGLDGEVKKFVKNYKSLQDSLKKAEENDTINKTAEKFDERVDKALAGFKNKHYKNQLQEIEHFKNQYASLNSEIKKLIKNYDRLLEHEKWIDSQEWGGQIRVREQTGEEQKERTRKVLFATLVLVAPFLIFVPLFLGISFASVVFVNSWWFWGFFIGAVVALVIWLFIDAKVNYGDFAMTAVFKISVAVILVLAIGGIHFAAINPAIQLSKPLIELEFNLISDGTAYEVTGSSTSNATVVIIPETHNGLPVTHIADEAFFDNKNIAKLVLPNSMRVIGEAAFFGCKNLTDITLNDGLTTIKDQAFATHAYEDVETLSRKEARRNYKKNTNKKHAIFVPISVSGIGNLVFWGRSGLTLNFEVRQSIFSPRYRGYIKKSTIWFRGYEEYTIDANYSAKRP